MAVNSIQTVEPRLSARASSKETPLKMALKWHYIYDVPNFIANCRQMDIILSLTTVAFNFLADM